MRETEEREREREESERRERRQRRRLCSGIRCYLREGESSRSTDTRALSEDVFQDLMEA